MSWPADFWGGILVYMSYNPLDDEIDNIVLEIFDNQMPRQLKYTLSYSGSYGINPASTVGVFRLDSLAYKAINQQGNNSCALNSGKDYFNIDDGNNIFSNYKCVGTQFLPVTYLTQPSAKIQNNKTHITWSIASQINNEKYIIEYSVDVIHFEAIGEIPGNGNSTETKHYNFIHDRPSAGINYYRIKQVDFDEQYSYSNVVELHVDHDSRVKNIMMAPNPVVRGQAFRFFGLNPGEEIKMYNLQGHKVPLRKISDNHEYIVHAPNGRHYAVGNKQGLNTKIMVIE